MREALPTTILPSPSQHRYREQLGFMARFPGYTTVTRGETLTLWYRAGEDPQRLVLRLRDAGLEVGGDESVARRILRIDAEPVPGDFVEGLPLPHQRLYRRFAGVRPVLFAEPYEGLAWTILGQQITVRFAADLKEAVANRYGSVISCGDRRIAVFPSAARMAAVPVHELASLRLSRQKAATLVSVAQGIAAGDLDMDALYRATSEEAMETLRRFKGIGPWTAEYCLLRVFGHSDVIPAADAGLKRAWAREAGLPRVSEQEVRQAAEAWRGWRSDFAFWLWLANVMSKPG